MKIYELKGVKHWEEGLVHSMCLVDVSCKYCCYLGHMFVSSRFLTEGDVWLSPLGMGRC